MSKQKIVIGLTTVIALALAGGAVVWSMGSSEQNTFSRSELAAYDGKEGRDCYVAVEGVVYQIDQGRLWKNGTHTTSNGQAHCGHDLTDTIGKSPHGTAKLKTLPVVGKME